MVSVIPDLNRSHVGDALALLPTWPERFVQTAVTSPPYWALRDYDVPPTAWPAVEYLPMPGLPPVTVPAQEVCLGLEATPQEYVGHLVHLFREVWRVLRDDGTAWLNLGDTYAQGRGSSGQQKEGGELAGRKATEARNAASRARVASGIGRGAHTPGIKEKDLLGIPWRAAFALQADGWYLRSDIIWAKPNPMPESVQDRPVKAHEYLFLLAKSERYYFDAKAIREPGTGRDPGNVAPHKHEGQAMAETKRGLTAIEAAEWRSKRSVWTVGSRPYHEAHFAVFPPDLIRPCILAGAPESAQAVVLDPFMGSGTTGQVAQSLGRSWIGCELNPDNDRLIAGRTRQAVLL